MPDAKLSEQRVDGTDLNSVSPAFVAQFSRGDIVVKDRFDHWKYREALDDLHLRSRPLITLQQFLQYDSRGVNRIAPSERIAQMLHLG